MLASRLAKVPESVYRALGLVFFVGVVGWRASCYRTQAFPFWVVETLGYVLIVLGYLRRAPALERPTSWVEVVLPLVGGPFPFLLHNPWSPEHPIVDARALALLTLVGDAVMVASYAFLGGSFAILVEARPLRSGGPYRWVRHPVYLGQLLATLGVALDFFSPLDAALWVTFVAIQVGRAALEERKLARATPGYAEYRARTWMFVPFVV